MRFVHSAAAVVALLLLAALTGSAQARNPLVGVWTVAEGTTLPSGSVRENPKGLLIFTGRHFSWIIFFGTRPDYKSPAEATDAQRLQYSRRSVPTLALTASRVRRSHCTSRRRSTRTCTRQATPKSGISR